MSQYYSNEIITNDANLYADDLILNASCSFSVIDNGKKCNCCKCPKLIISTSLVIENKIMIINIPNRYFSNLSKHCLKIPQKIPNNTEFYKVKICCIGENPIDLFDIFGNHIKSNQIKSDCLYPIIYGNDPVHFSILEKIH